MKVHRWRNQSQRFRRRRNQSTWFYAARETRGTWDIRSIWGTGTRRLVRTTQNPEVERSQVRRQESAQSSDSLETGRSIGSFKLYLYKETCTGTNSKNRDSEHEEHEPSVHDEDLPFPTEEVANYTSLLNILNGSIEDKCVDMVNVHVFVTESSHSSWTKLFGEAGARTRTSRTFRACSKSHRN